MIWTGPSQKRKVTKLDVILCDRPAAIDIAPYVLPFALPGRKEDEWRAIAFVGHIGLAGPADRGTAGGEDHLTVRVGLESPVDHRGHHFLGFPLVEAALHEFGAAGGQQRA